VIRIPEKGSPDNPLMKRGDIFRWGVEKEWQPEYNKHPMMEKRSKILCVIYDCDGVLFDSLDANRWFYSSLCEAAGRPPLTDQELRYAHTHTVYEGIHHIFRDSPNLEEKALEIFSRMDPGESISRLKMEPHLVPTLETLKAKGILRAISTSRTTNMEMLLKRFSLEPLFDLVVTSRDVLNPKPHPESIEKILQAFSLRNEEVLFVGDSETDGKAARNAGVKFIAYRNPEIEADAYIEDHRDLLQFL
jgi:HAD superfamily hydrolase (TIGR01549 family)